MLILHGEKGSAKSTLQTLIKMLVDPAKPRLLTAYKDEKEFIQQLAHNHVAQTTFDTQFEVVEEVNTG